VLAAGLVLGLGATVTLAAWNDAEWITGGFDSDGDGIADTPGVGTSIFEVQQNVSSPYVDSEWADRETNSGGPLTFTTGNLSLTPGEAVFAPVSLTTTATSVAAETLTLAAATPAAGVTAVDADSLLFNALELRVVVNTSADTDAPVACAAAAFSPTATYVVGSAVASEPLTTAGDTTTALAAASADKQDYCFEVSLPDTAPSTLQGRAVAPAWQFISASVE
ncbi:MAG TPA: SipW-dependent-type signal peptide-containing protein, partial [Glaciihabitans sp.]|nr:SipW-dependent-type signal peptide-containing protein [Glaciihabitans sp.]